MANFERIKKMELKTRAASYLFSPRLFPSIKQSIAGEENPEFLLKNDFSPEEHNGPIEYLINHVRLFCHCLLPEVNTLNQHQAETTLHALDSIRYLLHPFAPE